MVVQLCSNWQRVYRVKFAIILHDRLIPEHLEGSRECLTRNRKALGEPVQRFLVTFLG